MRDKLFFICIGGFITGILFRSFIDIGFSFSLFLIFLGSVLFIFRKLSSPVPVAIGTGGLLLGAAFIFSAGLGIARYAAADFGKGDPVLSKHIGQMVTIRGLIFEEPDSRESSTHLTLSLQELIENGATTTLFSKALLITKLHSPHQYGDAVEVRGELVLPKNFTDEDTGREFNYVKYLEKDGIHYQMFQPKITLLASGQGNGIKAGLFSLKQSFTGHIRRLIPEPESSLLSGLIVGAKQSLGKDLLDDFRTAGVIHIVVLSGYNITIVADAIMSFFGLVLPRVFALSSGALGIVLFAVMTGGSATVVRASLMALLVLLARSTGRTYAITRALLIAGFLMVFQNPKILVFDVSFQLSFLATVALIYVSPIVEGKLGWVTNRWKIREVMTATISTQIFVLPFILYEMGQLSIVALPVNLLVLLFIPATMLFGFLTGLLGFASSILAWPFALIAYGLLAYELAVVEWFAHLPFASLIIPPFPFWIVVLCYGAYAVLLFRLWRKENHPSSALGGGGVGEAL